jgi:SAM-dependent methyltransferase
MTTDSTFRDYVLNTDLMNWYSEYQKRYAQNIRESDKVLIDAVRAATAEAISRGERPRVLDIGCSTGNLLLHMHRLLPDLRLFGGDLEPNVIAACKTNPELKDIDFAEMDMLALDDNARYDVVVANAALMCFSLTEFPIAVASIAKALRPGGTVLAFDLFHPFRQELEIKETSRVHARGLVLHLRSYDLVREAYTAAGLADPSFTPFYLPIELPKPADLADVTSYTVEDNVGRRLSFRGSLFQPWCHVSSSRVRSA